MRKYIAITVFTCLFLTCGAQAFFFDKEIDSPYKKGEYVFVYTAGWRPGLIIEVKEHKNLFYYKLSLVGYSSKYDFWTTGQYLRKINY